MAKRRRHGERRPAQRLILDGGAVIALARNDVRARAALAAAHEVGADIAIPAVVLAETVRGAAADAPVNRVVKAVGLTLPADEGAGRVAGALLGGTGSRSTVDALVVAAAIGWGGGLVLTGDPDDLGPLAERDPRVIIEPL